MQDALQRHFPPIGNAGELRAVIESICAEFGRITQLEILREPATSGTYCACFLRLNSAKAEAALLKKYRATQFAGEIYFDVRIADT